MLLEQDQAERLRMVVRGGDRQAALVTVSALAAAHHSRSPALLAEVIDDATSHLTPDDLNAIAEYLASLEPLPDEAPPASDEKE